MTKTKVVDPDEFYNFVVVDIFIWNHLRSQHMFEFYNFIVADFSFKII